MGEKKNKCNRKGGERERKHHRVTENTENTSGGEEK
jgi:hypothetical protein